MSEPTFQEVIREALNDRAAQIHTMIPGEVTSVDASKGTVSVQPLIKNRVRTRDGGFLYETLPVVHNVPLAFPQGGNTFIRWTVSKGDPVELRFSEVDFGQYRQTGKIAEPGDDTRHGLGYPIACPSFTGHGSAAVPGGDTVVIEGAKIEAGNGAKDSVVTWPQLIEHLTTQKFPVGVYAPPVPIPSTNLKAKG